MLLFCRRTPGTDNTGVRNILSGADDDGDAGARVAVRLIMVDRDTVIRPLLRLAGHEKWPTIHKREIHDPFEEDRVDVAVALAINVHGLGGALGAFDLATAGDQGSTEHYWISSDSKKSANEKLWIESSVSHFGVRLIWLTGWGNLRACFKSMLK